MEPLRPDDRRHDDRADGRDPGRDDHHDGAGTIGHDDHADRG